MALDGEVLALESSGPSNYMSVGARAAKDSLESLVSSLSAAAGAKGGEIVAAGFGLSGLDRPKDHEALVELLGSIGATRWPYELLNDAFLALRAGTVDGVGIAAVAGTGCNTVGVDARGRHERVGGLAYECGDFGGAVDLGIAALRAAFHGEDGRGPATLLSEAMRRVLGVDRLDDVLDRMSPDAKVAFAPGALAPALFETAQEGDAVALAILERAGRELGVAARLVAERLFADTDSFPLALGGKVLAHGKCDAMRDALVEQVRQRFANVQPVRLFADPVMGAALLAIDRLVAVGHASAPSNWPASKVLATAAKALGEWEWRAA